MIAKCKKFLLPKSALQFEALCFQILAVPLAFRGAASKTFRPQG